MKKCPFCFEEIQDDAIKCRYCNEWLDRRNTIAGLFSKAKGSLKQQIEDYKSRTTGYLDLPVHGKPLKIDKIILFTDKLVVGNEQFQFNDLENIFYYSKTYGSASSSTNSMCLTLFFNNHGSQRKLSVFKEDDTNTVLGKNISIKVREQVNLLYQYISKETYNQRINTYIKELYTLGYINYVNGLTIYKNGDVYSSGTFVTNLVEASKNGRLEFGPISGSFEIYIYKDAGPFGVSFGRYLDFENTQLHFAVYLDTDIMKLLLVDLLLNSGKLDPDRLASYLK